MRKGRNEAEMAMADRNLVSKIAMGAFIALGGCASPNSNLPDAPSTYSPAAQGGYGYQQPEYGASPYGGAYAGGATPGAGYTPNFPSYPQDGEAYTPDYSAQSAYPGQSQDDLAENYIIGPLDELTIFVWRNPELGAKVQVRPDGRITTPLITDLAAAGKTPTQLAGDIRVQLSKYINEPLVNVIVSGFAGNYQQQVQIIGATEKPASLNYRANMTLLDALIAVGGLSEFAAGNRAKLSRLDRASGKRQEYRLRIDDLLEDGDMRANVLLQPGDVITIPTSMF